MATKSRLQWIEDEGDPLARNRLLFRSLRHDARREALYRDLQAAGFPALPFKSVLRKGGRGPWPSEDVYLLSAREDIARALREGSVKPYSELDSGGRFMLGVDEPAAHREQRGKAEQALAFQPADIELCVREALARTMVLAERLGEFDLVRDVAEQAALRLMSILFGMPAKAYFDLERGMRATYMRLTFQIIGRHFVENDGLPPPDSRQAAAAKDRMERVALHAAHGKEFPEFWDDELTAKRVGNASLVLAGSYPDDAEMTKIVILGLVAGTVGNVASAVANTIDWFFQEPWQGELLIDRASRAARRDDLRAELDQLVDLALSMRPPAPFLTRVTRSPMQVTGMKDHLPPGTTLLLALGADVPCDWSLLFGGDLSGPPYMHSCVGRHLALPLVRETVRQVLRLPGLARVIDPATGRPKPLVKQWGAACLSFPLRYARARRMNQQPLFLSLKIKEPVAENAFILKELTRVGAPVVERALAEASNVHFAWFGLIKGDTHLFMYTVYDGDFDAYVEHFAMKVPLFNEQFRYLEGAPPTPVREHPREFVEFLRKNNNAPLGGYFYSAYPGAGVAEIQKAGLGQPGVAGPPQGGSTSHQDGGSPMSAPPSDSELAQEAQGLPLTGYGARYAAMRNLVLTVTRPAEARRFLAALHGSDWLDFGGKMTDWPDTAGVNIGFSCEGLRVLGAPSNILDLFRKKSPAFSEGAPLRGGRCLGDAGVSAVERWKSVFQLRAAHVWIAINAADAQALEHATGSLLQLEGASGLAGWRSREAVADGEQMFDGGDRQKRLVHFGLRDNLTRPSIFAPDGKLPTAEGVALPAGDLLLGYPNSQRANVWAADGTARELGDFVRNGTFGILRLIEQDEAAFNAFLAERSSEWIKRPGYGFVTPDYLKAKLCGRWPGGAPVQPDEREEPADWTPAGPDFDFTQDKVGLGCPFGAHIRRANPRKDPLMPPVQRTVFRRSIPYGPRYGPGTESAERGLVGIFFCAHIDNQFELLVSEWLEKNPLGPKNAGRAKDPLSGHHDEAGAAFHVPLRGADPIVLKGFREFVRTRGTLYALFPSRSALRTIAGGDSWRAP